MKFTGEKLRKLRLTRGLKQGELALMMNVKQQRISKLEASEGISKEKEKQFLAVLKYSKKEAEAIFKMFSVPKERKQGIRRGYAILLK